MKKDRRDAGSPMKGTMRPEYDFSEGRRGVTSRRYAEGAKVVAISPEVLEGLADGVAVDEALRGLPPILKRRRES